MTLADPVKQRIEDLITDNRVVLFMKGTADMPQCGFSARTVQILQSLDVEFSTVDVLSDPEIRQGIKEFSEWPTIPQLYIGKEFVGGSDIVAQMMGNGDLHGMLGLSFEPPKPVEPPTVHFSDAFIDAIRAASTETEGLPRLQISPQWEYGIGFSDKAPGDCEIEVGGLVFLMDPSTVERAEGIRIDYRDGAQGGVLIDNPNEPAQVGRMPNHVLQQLREANHPLHLFDVRTQDEWNIAKIEGATLLDESGQNALLDLPKDAMIILYCHHGIRSMQAAGQLLTMGFKDVHNLEGGIDAWSLHVDNTVPRY